MSSYINIYIKDNKTKRFTRLFSMSRSSAFYGAFEDYNLWEKCIPFSDKLMLVKNNIEKKIEKYKNFIKEDEDKINFISQTNASLEEKLEKRDDCLDSIDGMKEEINDLEFALNLIQTLIIIVNDNYTAPDDTIYIGIENADPNGEEDE